MSKINTGSSYEGPYQWSIPVAPPITLREWFAGQALAGLMANKSNPLIYEPTQDAAYCYKIADAMLAQREKQSWQI